MSSQQQNSPIPLANAKSSPIPPKYTPLVARAVETFLLSRGHQPRIIYEPDGTITVLPPVGISLSDLPGFGSFIPVASDHAKKLSVHNPKEAKVSPEMKSCPSSQTGRLPPIGPANTEHYDEWGLRRDIPRQKGKERLTQMHLANLEKKVELANKRKADKLRVAGYEKECLDREAAREDRHNALGLDLKVAVGNSSESKSTARASMQNLGPSTIVDSKPVVQVNEKATPGAPKLAKPSVAKGDRQIHRTLYRDPNITVVLSTDAGVKVTEQKKNENTSSDCSELAQRKKTDKLLAVKHSEARTQSGKETTFQLRPKHDEPLTRGKALAENKSTSDKCEVAHQSKAGEKLAIRDPKAQSRALKEMIREMRHEAAKSKSIKGESTTMPSENTAPVVTPGTATAPDVVPEPSQANPTSGWLGGGFGFVGRMLFSSSSLEVKGTADERLAEWATELTEKDIPTSAALTSVQNVADSVISTSSNRTSHPISNTKTPDFEPVDDEWDFMSEVKEHRVEDAGGDEEWCLVKNSEPRKRRVIKLVDVEDDFTAVERPIAD